MSSANLAEPLTFARGPAWAHRIGLAPLTNQQSHADGTLSDDEFSWLSARAEGGFAMVMTCAAHVEATGQGFPGQLGIWGDHQLPGLARLAKGLKARGAVAAVQLHHAGRRSPPDLIDTQPVCAFDDPETGARAQTGADITATIAAFIAAGRRAEAAGFDGVEIHGAHGYLIGQYLDAQNNQRTDGWGGDPLGRTRLLREIIAGLRANTGADFQIGLRLSPERFGIDTLEARSLMANLMAAGQLDYIDLSLWDVAKAPADPALQERTLLGWFADLPRHGTRLGVAGRLMSASACASALRAGADFVLAGRGAVLHHDFARRVLADPAFAAISLPVSRAYLAEERLGAAFIDYMAEWKGFVAAA
jgi:2,4-dienoyl-CoA reductase-like NADH-dependent reductase (Old Yellow Enzyme family)